MTNDNYPRMENGVVQEGRHNIRSAGPMTRTEEEAKARIWWRAPKPKSDFFFLSMTTRARNCMALAGVESLTQMLAMSDKELLAIRGLGKTVLAELRGLQESDLRAAREEYYGNDLSPRW